MLIIVFAAALLVGVASASWALLRLWHGLPRRNTDLVLF